MKVNAKSWHYRLAKIGCYSRWHGADICTYSRHVFAGGLFVSVVAYLLACALCWFWYLAFGFGVMTFMEWLGGGIIIIAVSFPAMAALSFCVVWAKDAYDNKYGASTKPPGFLATRYRAWKDKTCVLIDFE